MKFLPTATTLYVGLLACVSSCFGNTMTIASSATETTNNSGSATVNIVPNNDWAPAIAGSSWVSYTQSGDTGGSGFVHVPNGTITRFTDTFTVAGTPTSGSLTVLADDTASVMLNGILVVAMAPTAGNKYFLCSDYKIGCLVSTEGNIDISSFLTSGVNTLSFDVEQINDVSYGLDYSGTVNFTSSSVPEPGTLALFGLPLVALSLAFRKRKR